MIILGTGSGMLMQLMRDGQKKGGPENRTAPSKARLEPRQAYLTLCSSLERQTR